MEREDTTEATTELEAPRSATTIGSEFPLNTLFEPVSPDTAPAALGRFSIRGKVGRGGMGVVYLGYDDRLKRRAAVKVLPAGRAGGQAHARMLREAQALARVSHPNVVQIYESGEQGQDIYIAMEFVDGPTLGAWMREQSRTVSDICEVFIAAGRGLAAAHERGLTHRDFKPDNVMIGSDGRVRVLDFGLVRGHEPEVDVTRVTLAEASTLAHDRATPLPALTATGALLGTPAYMAPEQHRADVTDARTDQFSYCVTLWEALHGERPFAGQTLAALAANVLEGRLSTPPPGVEVPNQIRAALRRGLSTDPDDRWPSMEDLLEALSRAPWQKTVIGRRWLVFGVGTVVLLLALTAYMFGGGAKSEPAEQDLGQARGEQNREEDPVSVPQPSVDEHTLIAIDIALTSMSEDEALALIRPARDKLPDDPQLLWREGKALAMKRNMSNRVIAFDRYGKALEKDPSLLDDHDFIGELHVLLRNPKLQEQAINLALHKLGPVGHGFLIELVNISDSHKMLRWVDRHRVLDDLRSHPEALKRVNWKLNLARDLQQANDAPNPCTEFAKALDTIARTKDSYYLEPVVTAAPPTLGDDHDDVAACEGIPDKLALTRRVLKG